MYDRSAAPLRSRYECRRGAVAGLMPMPPRRSPLQEPHPPRQEAAPRIPATRGIETVGRHLWVRSPLRGQTRPLTAVLRKNSIRPAFVIEQRPSSALWDCRRPRMRGAVRPARMSLARAHPASIDIEAQSSRCVQILPEGRDQAGTHRCGLRRGTRACRTAAGAKGRRRCNMRGNQPPRVRR